MHVKAELCRQITTEDHILPPKFEVVLAGDLHRNGPQRPKVDDLIRVAMEEMEDDGRGGSLYAV